jgi:hypothetical protein
VAKSHSIALSRERLGILLKAYTEAQKGEAVREFDRRIKKVASTKPLEPERSFVAT